MRAGLTHVIVGDVDLLNHGCDWVSWYNFKCCRNERQVRKSVAYADLVDDKTNEQFASCIAREACGLVRENDLGLEEKKK